MNKTFIIAELGINHNGTMLMAQQMIEGAKEAGADAVKFQKRDIYKVYSKEDLNKPRESPWGTTTEQQKLGIEFGKAEYDAIDEYCKSIKMPWFASPWDLNSVEFLKAYKLPFNKIAAPMLAHIELLEAIADQRKHTFISTGMSTLEEIEIAVNIFKKHRCPFELMHCNSAYPAKTSELNLRTILTLREQFDCDVGYSCHSPGILPPVLAIMFGASSVEKHITLDRTIYGSDQPSSVEIHGFAKMVEFIRTAEEAIGDGIKRIYPDEEKGKLKLRRTKDY
jgi:N-acetylneuraminate synthase